ncbi:MAG: metal ABC transporter permease [Verrucomicrobiota bacterium JB022]|nr:metal ABC transporter permease [Verrucomicrobiota bacterium JB022]
MDLIPAFDFQRVFVEPWQIDFAGSLQMVLMAFFVSAASGLIGTFLLLRRMALMGDTISHSLLPGIVAAFFISGSRATLPMFIGAAVAGILTVLLVEYIHKSSRVKADAAMGITFSSFFALGVLAIAVFADQIDLDADCVLYGELEFIPLFYPVEFLGLPLGTVPLVRMGLVLLGLVALIVAFYRPLVVNTFDPGLGRSLGLKPKTFHYGMMFVLSLVIVSAFEAVGPIVVIAMLIIPGASALLVASRLPHVLLVSVLLSALYAISGFHLAVWLDTTTSGAVATVALGYFLLIWAGRLLWQRGQQRAAAHEKTAPAIEAA